MSDWDKYEKLVLHELAELKSSQKALHQAIAEIKKSLDDHMKDESLILSTMSKKLEETRFKTNLIWSGIAFILTPIITYVTSLFIGGK